MTKHQELAGRRALVTGATSGIGLAIADGLAARGAAVVRHGLDGDLAVDLARPGAGTQIAREVGEVDVLVLSASVQIRASAFSLDADDVDLQLRTNLISSLELLGALVPGMRARGWGRVLVIGSVQAIAPHPEMAVYAASKAALLNVVRNLAKQSAGDGVTINAISPGVISTPRNEEALSDAEYLDRVVAGIPARRIGVPADCVPLAMLLCGPDSAYITGQDIVVDGGMLL